MSISVYKVGSVATISGVFTDAAGNAQDPDGLALKYADPDGVEVTLTYGTDAALVKDSTGNYHADITVGVAGSWFFRWAATGNGASAEDDEFSVEGTSL